MVPVLLQMALLIACGVGWRVLRPGGLDPDDTRRVLTGLVYYLLLPALVLMVLWQAPLGLNSVRIAASAAGGVLGALGLGWLACRVCRVSPRVAGAAILAAGFPNATYMGLPVLEQTLGSWARSIAIQYDLFACTPLLLTLGIALARRYGRGGDDGHPLLGLLKVPPLWAAVGGVALNLIGVPAPAPLHGALDMLAAGVVPLMLIAIGLSLRWEVVNVGTLRTAVPILLIQLLAMPVLVWALGGTLGLSGVQLKAVVLEGAMPSMVLGVVLCDRFGLDTGLYAAAVTLSTLCSLITLPLWFVWLS